MYFSEVKGFFFDHLLLVHLGICCIQFFCVLHYKSLILNNLYIYFHEPNEWVYLLNYLGLFSILLAFIVNLLAHLFFFSTKFHPTRLGFLPSSDLFFQKFVTLLAWNSYLHSFIRYLRVILKIVLLLQIKVFRFLF